MDYVTMANALANAIVVAGLDLWWDYLIGREYGSFPVSFQRAVAWAKVRPGRSHYDRGYDGKIDQNRQQILNDRSQRTTAKSRV